MDLGPIGGEGVRRGSSTVHITYVTFAGYPNPWRRAGPLSFKYIY